MKGVVAVTSYDMYVSVTRMQTKEKIVKSYNRGLAKTSLV